MKKKASANVQTDDHQLTDNADGIVDETADNIFDESIVDPALDVATGDGGAAGCDQNDAAAMATEALPQNSAEHEFGSDSDASNEPQAQADPEAVAPLDRFEAAAEPGFAAYPVPTSGRWRRSRLFYGVLLVLILSALLGLAWQVWVLHQQAQDFRRETASRLVDSERRLNESNALIRQQDEHIVALQGKTGGLESQLAASSGQAAALERLYQDLTRSRSDQVLAEVEQALSIAAQQLQLAGNVGAALTALQHAEAMLAMPEQGNLQPLRRAILKDIDEIRARPQLDVSGLALRLENMLERINSLPLAYEVIVMHDNEGETKQELPTFDIKQPFVFAKALGHDLWRELRGLVRFERLENLDPVLLSPTQMAYLRENVKIRLLTARLALLARDGRTFSSDLSQAHQWIARYFNVQDAAVVQVLADLKELEPLQVKAEEFSLTESFAALRLLQARQTNYLVPNLPDKE